MGIAKASVGGAMFLALAVAPGIAADTKPHIDTSGVNVQPAYPANAYGTGERGAVVMAVAVTPDGKVSRVRLVQTSGFNDLDSAAIAGVMGWKFIPATHDGVDVEDVSMVKLVFQPPDAADGASSTPAQPVPDPTIYLASSIDMKAERGKETDEKKPLPCPNGRIDVTLQFLHQNGAAALPGNHDPYAFAGVQVSAGKDDRASVLMVDREEYSPPMQNFIFQRTHMGGQKTDLQYSFFSYIGNLQTVSLVWNADGLITGYVGARQTQQTQLPSQPTHFRLLVSGAAARFTGAELTCTPAPAG
jgi:TonB family protein